MYDYETIGIPRVTEGGWIVTDYEQRPIPKCVAFLSSEPKLIKPVKKKKK